MLDKKQKSKLNLNKIQSKIITLMRVQKQCNNKDENN